MPYHKVNEQTELRLVDRQHSEELFKLFESNREYLGRWHAWVDEMQSVESVEKAIVTWQEQHAKNLGCYVGIWFKGQFCGMINHLNVDWINRQTFLCYWLDAGHQGMGIMTACCRTFIAHGFNTWNLNRISIACATENTRSRGVPERLGFKLEGIIRGSGMLRGRYVDAAIYGLLRSDRTEGSFTDPAEKPVF
jgi:ribosomal-protein-serine acetyltransferase